MHTTTLTRLLRWLFWPLAAIALLETAGQVGIVDDAFVSFRYARSAAAGWGLVYNYGEVVEGYSNFLWTVLFVPAFQLGLPPEGVVPLAQFLGMLCALGTLALTVKLCRELLRRQGLAAGAWPWLAAALLLSSHEFRAWSTSGLETGLFALAVTSGWYWSLYRPCRRDAVLAGLSWLIACLTRPEGVLTWAASALLRLVDGRELPVSQRWRLLGSDVGFVVLGLLPYQALRYLTFGDLVPNTAYAKAALEGGDHGWSYLWSILSAYPAMLLLALGGAAVLGPGGWVLGATVLGFFAYWVKVGGDWMGHRFLVPLLPLLLSLAVLALARLVEELRSQSAPALRYTAVGGLAVYLAMSLGAASLCSVTGLGKLSLRPNTLRRQAGEWLLREAGDGAWGSAESALVSGDCEPMYYYWPLPAINIFGLTDREIAHSDVYVKATLPGHAKNGLGLAIARRPKFVQVHWRHHYLIPPEIREEYEERWMRDDAGRLLEGSFLLVRKW